ncbi:uncharacterized protein LOC108867926 isoform X2 [Pyrus x bretschneideri]|uniref:uncharacterized protein LOC108867926 isoform X1 n=1 Tax=Pyrus x bretschneideri TaxID=225117 RepID=UPI000870B483|nr:uncharacterized protein LOC108867926 isoform X1 [Pyrus x bretschneideri]XP_048437732.1 uncharacterized protein LOC108867926 isoform X2 [Pyrus x bretschneideri]
MASEYSRFHHHHRHSQNLRMHNHQRCTFLPMLCSRPSIKDVRLPKSASVKEDALSPRISCMGQVKRSNKVTGFPTPLATHRLLTISSNPNSKDNISSPNNHHHNHLKYSKLKKRFSGKNLNNPNAAAAATTTTTTRNTTTRCSRRQVIVNSKNGGSGPGSSNNGAYINLVDLDPPLPVIKRVHKKPAEEQEEEVKSLWKRRSGGVELKRLQLKQIHHRRHLNQSITV